MRRLPPLACLLGVVATFASATLSAQQSDPQAEAATLANALQGQVNAAVTSNAAPNAVPGYGGADLPQSQYLNDPDGLATAGASAAASSTAYAVVTNPSLPSVDISTLGLTNAQTVETNPAAYTGATDTNSSTGSCQQMPSTPGAPSTYYDSCQIGAAETDSNFTCTIGWNNQVATEYQYTCHTSAWSIYNPNTKQTIPWGSISDCGTLPTQAACIAVSSTTQPTTTSWPAGADAEHIFAETDTTYNCTSAGSYGTGASSTYCLSFGALCLVPPAADKAPGVSGVVSSGTISKYETSSVDNSTCQADLNALPSAVTCLPPTQTCIDSSPATRTVDGVAVTHDCWQWQATYQCASLSSGNSCASLSENAECSFDHEVCLDNPQNGACQVRSEVYTCTAPAATQNGQVYACSGGVDCIDGSCFQLPRSPAPDLANALVAMNAMKDATGQFDPNTLTVFGGDATGCHKPLFGLVNCCAGKVSGLLTASSSAIAMAGLLTGNYAFLLSMVTQFLVIFMCSQEEMLLDVKDRMGLCHYVGEYCSEQLLFVCGTERKTYCCYQSKLARVIEEQGRAQLGLDFGSAQNPTCGGFTLAQFSELDLSKMDFSEVFADYTSAVSLPSSLQTSAQIQEQVEAYYQTHGTTSP